MNYIFVADEKEFKEIKVPKELKNKVKKIITGYGEYYTLKTIIDMFKKGVFKKGDKFYNVGYVGANTHKIGDVISIGKSDREKYSSFAKNKIYTLDKKSKVTCYTSDDFVERTNHKGVFDMELYVLATIFPKIKAIKIVSDTLSLKQYTKVDLKKSWQKVNEMLFAKMN